MKTGMLHFLRLFSFSAHQPPINVRIPKYNKKITDLLFSAYRRADDRKSVWYDVSLSYDIVSEDRIKCLHDIAFSHDTVSEDRIFILFYTMYDLLSFAKRFFVLFVCLFCPTNMHQNNFWRRTKANRQNRSANTT